MNKRITCTTYEKLWAKLKAKYGTPDYLNDDCPEDGYWFLNGKTVALTGDPWDMIYNPDTKCCSVEVRPITRRDIEYFGAPDVINYPQLKTHKIKYFMAKQSWENAYPEMSDDLIKGSRYESWDVDGGVYVIKTPAPEGRFLPSKR